MQALGWYDEYEERWYISDLGDMVECELGGRVNRYLSAGISGTPQFYGIMAHSIHASHYGLQPWLEPHRDVIWDALVAAR